MEETKYERECGAKALDILRCKSELAVMQRGIVDDSCIKLSRHLMLRVINFADSATSIRAQALADVLDTVDDVKSGYKRVPAAVADIYGGLLQQFEGTIRPDALATYYATAGYQTVDWGEVSNDVQ